MQSKCVSLLAASAVLSLALGCQQPQEEENLTPAERDLMQLAEWMTGSFSSAEQHAADPDNYFDIRLHMVPIWQEREDGPWLYVEQAAADRLGEPYRQRVYHLVLQQDGSIISHVFTLPGDALRYAGSWKREAPLADLGPGDLELREGCSMIMRREDGRFVGGTVGKGCKSTLRGAAYAASEATVTPSELISWDRGFNEAGEQVWGATGGGYVFKKLAESNAAAR